MEVVALNERLRSDFSPLLKLLPPPYAVSAFATLQNSVLSTKDLKAASLNDRYTQHCRYMLWRLNSYQYGSSSAFLLDLEQLERVAEATETKQLVKSILDRLVASEGKKQEQESVLKVVKKSEALDCGIPGLQETTTTGHSEAETENNTTWRCNLSVGGQIVTIGSFKTREDAEEGYEEQRKKMAENAAGFNKMRQLAAKRDEEQRQEDERVLKEALDQCHPRLTTMKMSSVPPAPVSNAARGIPRSLAKSIGASSSPAASPAPSEAGASPLKVSRVSKKQKPEVLGSSSVKKQKIDTAAANSSASNRSYLTLRRVIQTRLCRHLKGQQVCVLADPNNRENVRWKASGRLEAGKVYHLGKKKQMSFADFVRDKLGHPMSACEHMFLVETRESIDDHLKVCDAFSDKERELGYPQLMRSKKTRRR